jgi:hypothetical protein
MQTATSAARAGGAEDPLFHWARAASVTKMSKGIGVPDWAAQETFDVCYATGLAMQAMTGVGVTEGDTRVAAVHLAQAIRASSSQVHFAVHCGRIQILGPVSRGAGQAVAAVSAATAAVQRGAAEGGQWGAGRVIAAARSPLAAAVVASGSGGGAAGAGLLLGGAEVQNQQGGAVGVGLTSHEASAPAEAAPVALCQNVGRRLVAAASVRAARAVGVELVQQQWQSTGVVEGPPGQLPGQWAGVDVSGVTAVLQAIAAVTPVAALILTPAFPMQLGFMAVDTRGLSALQVRVDRTCTWWTGHVLWHWLTVLFVPLQSCLCLREFRSGVVRFLPGWRFSWHTISMK